mgnify:CR=1 FL=1
MKAVPILGQHDSRWGAQRLGTGSYDGAKLINTTIADYGCLITCLTMANLAFDPGSNLLVNNVDDIFTNQKGYTDGRGHFSPAAGCNLVVWGRIQQLLPNMGYHTMADYSNRPADITRLRQWINEGGLVVLQVNWKGRPGAMHFVLGKGHSGGPDILVNDPETGREQWFSSKLFGTGVAATDILKAYFFKDAISAAAPNYPPPVAPVPVTNPAPGMGSGPALEPETTKEEEVTQAEHDAVVAALKQNHDNELKALNGELAKATQLLNTQSDTISRLAADIDKYVPEYVRTWADGETKEVASTAPIILVDFADQMPALEYEENTLFVVQGQPFTVAGKRYYRTKKSVAGGYYYGVPEDLVKDYVHEEPKSVLDLSAARTSLTVSQNIHAMAADSSIGGILAKIFKPRRK